MVLFFLKVGKVTQRESCQCQLLDALSVREEREVSLPYFRLEPEAAGNAGDQRKSGKIRLRATSSCQGSI